MSRLGNIADQENINPVSGLLSYQSLQDGKVQLGNRGSKDTHASIQRGPARRPLSDVTEHFTAQLGKGGGADTQGSHILLTGQPPESRQAESIFKGPGVSLDGSYLQAVARNNLRRMR